MKDIFESLRKTRNAFFGQIVGILGAGEITDATWEDLEALLIQGDVGVATSTTLVNRLRKRAHEEGIYKAPTCMRCWSKRSRGSCRRPGR
jgi:fused signal recognition particle receptor